jgi:TrmH family RNA methyltransferase
VDQLADAGIPAIQCTASVLRHALRAQRPVDMLAVATLGAENDETRPYGDFAVVLDGVADPGNLGTIVRTACGLGAFDVVCTDGDTDLTSRRVLDASRGSVLRASLRRYENVPDALDALRGKGFQIVTGSPRGTSLQSLAPLSGQPVALVVGNETDGVGQETLERSDIVVRIPMSGEVESLNVGVATGLSIAELRLRMLLAGITERAAGTLETELSAALHDVRQAQDRRLAELEHLDVAEMALLSARVAGAEPDLPEEELAGASDSLTAWGYLHEEQPTDAGRHALAALWHTVPDAELLDPAEREQLRALLAKLRQSGLRQNGA